MYKVEHLKDTIYQVVYHYNVCDIITAAREVKLQGSISDCNAWLQLKEKNYL